MYLSSEEIKRIEPLKGCAMAGIIQGLIGIKGAIPLVHGPLSCSSGHRMTFLFADREPILPTTALTEAELTLGSQSKLKNALKEVYEIFEPRYIVIIKTCALSMTGENFEQIIHEFKNTHNCRISVIDGSGLQGEENDGFKMLYKEFNNKFLADKGKTSQDKIALDGMGPGDFNIKDNFNLLKRTVLNNLEIEVGPSLFVDFELADEIESYKRGAKLKIGHLWSDYDVEQNKPAPVGIDGTYDWLSWLANKMHIQQKNSHISNYQSFQQKFNAVKEESDLGKKKVFIEGDSWYALGLAKFLKKELNFEVLISTDEYGYQFNAKYNIADKCYCDIGGYELYLICQDFSPDIVFGSSFIKDEDKWKHICFTQPIYHLEEPEPGILGYEGAFNLANKIISAIG